MAGCSAPFIGPDPAHRVDYVQVRGPQTDTAAQNVARRLSVGLPDNPRPYRCQLDLGPDGEPTPESIARCAAGGRALRKEKPRFKTPEGARQRQVEAAATPEPLPEPEFLTIQMDQFAGAGATADRFSPLQPRPAVLETVQLNISSGDNANSHIQLLLRYGDDQTAGLQDNDRDIFIYPDQVVGSVLPAGTGDGQFTYQMNLPLLTVPFLFHARAINVGGISVLHVGWVLTLRVIQPADRRRFIPAHLSPALQIADFAHLPLPPGRTRFRFPGFARPQGSDNYGKIEELAQQLREQPFGVPHSQMIAKAQEAGFGANAERAVNLAITQAARPPNIALLASRL